MYRLLLLHNIRSAHNVGSLFRTADGAGISHIFLTGYTPRPVDQWGRGQADIRKTALGAEKSVPWTYDKNPTTVIQKLQKEHYAIVGIEQDACSIDYRTYIQKGPTLFVLGNEVRGISPSLRKQCDVLLEIPMHGKKESLNVSVAGGIVLFRYAE